MTYLLKRIAQDEEGTFGILYDSTGIQLCVTCELPWDDDIAAKSCIPEGTYHCIPHNSPEHPKTWEVTNVPGRSEILIHNANLPSQLLGCIGVGDGFGVLEGMKAVLNSVATMNVLRRILPEEFDLTIENDIQS